jgi:aminotransferase
MAQSVEQLAADRVHGVPFSGIRKVFEAVRSMEAEGRDVIHWQIGRPDFDTPEHIKRAAGAALERGEVHYAPNLGIPSLRQAIAERTFLDTGVPVDWQKQVIVMAGANEGIMVAMLALINPGDEVLLADPNWHHYKSCAVLAGGKPVVVPTRGEANFSMEPGEVASRITKRTKMLCITSPGNPTGCVESRENLQALAELARKHNLIVLMDQIYNRIYYGQEEIAPSIYSFEGMPERTVIVNGFSKTYSMDGWRLGWTVASPELTQVLLKVRQYTTVCVNTFIQYGAAEGLSGDQACVGEMVGAFAERRKIIVDGLEAIEGVQLAEPMGAFYAFPDMSRFGKNSAELAEYLLREHGIATVAGSVFGAAGEGHIRIAYSCSTEECGRGMERLRQALSQLRH